MNYLELIYAFFASFFFSIIFNLTGRKLIYSGICGAIGWYTYLVFSSINYTKTASFFMAAVVITVYSEIMAKKLQTPITTMLIPGLIPLVPGSGIYFTMSSLVENNFSKASEIGVETIFLTVALSIGIFLVSTFSQIIFRTKKYLKIINKYKLHKFYK